MWWVQREVKDHNHRIAGGKKDGDFSGKESEAGTSNWRKDALNIGVNQMKLQVETDIAEETTTWLAYLCLSVLGGLETWFFG